MVESDASLEVAGLSSLSRESQEALTDGEGAESDGAEGTVVVAISEEERKLLQSLLIEAYDNFNGAGETETAMTAKGLSERLIVE